MDVSPEGEVKMIAAELRGGNKPSLNEALGWIGSRVDDIYGANVGRLEDVWIDPGTGVPRWLLVKEGRFGGRSTLVPVSDATAGYGQVWVPYEREVVHQAPQIEPGAPLTQQVESTLRNHYAANAPAAVSHRSQPAGWEDAQGGMGVTSATVRLAPSPSPEAGPAASEFSAPRLPLRPAPPVAPPSVSGHTEPPPPPAPEPAAQAPPNDPQRVEFPSRQQPPSQTPQSPSGYLPPPWGQQQQPQFAPPYVPQQQPPQDPVSTLAGLPPGHYVEIELAGELTICGELRQVRVIPRDGGRGGPG